MKTECAPTTLSFALLPLESESKLCATDSGYKLYPFTGMPSQDEIQAMCKSKACNKMLGEARDSDMPDCDLTINGTAYNIQESIELMFAGCEIIDVNELSG
ncbi:elicitin-like protein [Phytophthora infestans T30-4]|uniref:Elicitin n=1 Tax=Phytophthora infestans (strain T30-4) TaxID=403677 RepID=D0N9P5_PHYIT|nr:elicitin-like protein [Phytophthora infestans T30-4]EEY54533.1 elicitin-like protein [Phytophthora infestans T30-4]|eukprot:XP_002904355.1 elicitin-like protein [Phytophthora infestans T30-4]